MSEQQEDSLWVIVNKLGVVLLLTSIAFLFLAFIIGFVEIVSLLLGMIISSLVMIIYSRRHRRGIQMDSTSEVPSQSSDVNELICPWCHKRHPKDTELEEDEVNPYCSVACYAANNYDFLMMVCIFYAITVVSSLPIIFLTLSFAWPVFLLAFLALSLPYYLLYKGHTALYLRNKYSRME